MKKAWLLLFFLPLLSCSYLTEFFIYNNTDVPIRITYVVKYPMVNDAFLSNPKLKAFESYTKVDTEEITRKPIFDTESVTLTCSLHPKQALWIGAATNFSLESKYGAEKLGANPVSLTIETGHGFIQADSTSLLSLVKTYTS